MTATATPADRTDAYPSQYWTWNDRQIHYVRAGEPVGDRPALLLVHGFGASTDHWRKNIDALKRDFEVYAIDLLGFGRSAKPDIPYSGDLWRDQLRDFIDEKIGRPTAIAGNSLGGYTALNTGATCPDRVAGIALLNSAGPFSDANPQKPPSSIKRAVRWLALQNWVAYLIFQNTRRKGVIRKTLEKVYLDKSAVTERLVDEIFRPSCDPGAAKVFASVFKTPRGATVDELLGQLERPLMTIWGEGDPWMKSRDRAAKFREFYPAVTEHCIQAGHCPHDEAPGLVNPLLRDWAIGLAAS
ncbi:MAG: alpha/beta fold hydrolase [Geitlerinemataceae cyanobacterium]